MVGRAVNMEVHNAALEEMAKEEWPFIHARALVEDSKVGARTKVWQFASVIRGAEIGEDCTIASGALLDGCKIGNRTIISQNVAMGPGFLVGNDCFIGPQVTLCNDLWPRAHRRGFDVERFKNGEFAVIVKDGASIGAGCTVVPGVVIGERSMIAAGCVVSKSVPADHLLKRDGTIEPIRAAPTRMRMAAC